MLYLTVVVSPNTTSYPVLPINATNLRSTEVGSPPREAMKSSPAKDSTNTARSTVTTGPETLSPPTERLPSEMNVPTPPVAERLAGMSPVENVLRDTDEAMTTINVSKALEGALGRIKWAMDAVSSVAEVRAMSSVPILDRAEFGR